jgi:hypothetical protein
MLGPLCQTDVILYVHEEELSNAEFGAAFQNGT